MNKEEKLLLEIESLKRQRQHLESLGFRARSSPRGFEGFSTRGGEDERGVFKGTYGPFLEKYFEADSEEKRGELMVKELNKMVYGKSIPKEIAIKTLTSKIRQAQKNLEEKGEFI